MKLNNNEYGFLKDRMEDFFSQDDINYYKNLKDTLSSHICRNCRNKRVESFNQILITIRNFIYWKREDEWKRSLLVGVCWYKSYICVNIRQMSYLLEKCKSSINGSFQRLFLIILPNKKKSAQILIEAIPYLKDRADLLKMWSVRQKLNESQNNMLFLNQNFQFKSVYYCPKKKVTNNNICVKNDQDSLKKSKKEESGAEKNEKINNGMANLIDNCGSKIVDEIFDNCDPKIMDEIFDNYDF